MKHYYSPKFYSDSLFCYLMPSSLLQGFRFHLSHIVSGSSLVHKQWKFPSLLGLLYVEYLCPLHLPFSSHAEIPTLCWCLEVGSFGRALDHDSGCLAFMTSISDLLGDPEDSPEPSEVSNTSWSGNQEMEPH